METIEELVKKSWEKQIDPETSSYECFFHYSDELLYSVGFKEGVESVQRWIPIKEDLPEIRKGIYQILIKNGSEINTMYIGGQRDIDLLEDLGFTHWRNIDLK